ncbi:MAG TPA: LysR family transcriptional regulator [Pseudolabrys sp.]|nr:LysR family transcriptional regulator [Pseudolabrys sp.]
MDRFRTMESFVRVVRSGSFTIAGHQLGLSRALVSRHVSELERRLGIRLLNRSTRSLSLTDEGRAYLDFCERIFRDIEDGERLAMRARQEVSGTLRVVAPKSFGSLHLADAAIAFARVQTRLHVSLSLEDVAFRRPYEFVERGLDLALRISSLRNSSLMEEKIAMLDWMVCASPDYLDEAGRPSRPEELAGHRCLIHTNVTAHDRIWRFEPVKGRPPGEGRGVSVKVSGAFFSNSALALRKAALAGLGIALVPRYVVADDLARATLLKVLPRHRPPPRPLFAVYPRAATPPPRVRLFVAFLRDWIEKENVNDRRR